VPGGGGGGGGCVAGGGSGIAAGLEMLGGRSAGKGRAGGVCCKGCGHGGIIGLTRKRGSGSSGFGGWGLMPARAGGSWTVKWVGWWSGVARAWEISAVGGVGGGGVAAGIGWVKSLSSRRLRWDPGREVAYGASTWKSRWGWGGTGGAGGGAWGGWGGGGCGGGGWVPGGSRTRGGYSWGREGESAAWGCTRGAVWWGGVGGGVWGGGGVGRVGWGVPHCVGDLVAGPGSGYWEHGRGRARMRGWSQFGALLPGRGLGSGGGVGRVGGVMWPGRVRLGGRWVRSRVRVSGEGVGVCAVGTDAGGRVVSGESVLPVRGS